jgi:hypothetical protein
MLSEFKILFNNIKNFRHLLNEGVGESDLKKHIENHEWIYIYYTGDDKVAKGYRTVRPYVLGTSKAGNLVLRAWQDNPKNSWHFQNKPTRPDSRGHDYWSDHEGEKPGWRLFRLDKISKVYPTGKKFIDSNGLVMIPAGYHEGADKGMSSIIAYVSTKKEPDFEYQYDKDFYGQEYTRGEINKQKWDSIKRGNKNSKNISPQDVTKLSNIASNVLKKGKGSFLVAIDDKGNYQLITPKDKDKYGIPDIAIVGGLANLYDTLVKSNAPSDKRFFDTIKNKTLSQVGSKQEIAEELPSIPYNKKTFFKY